MRAMRDALKIDPCVGFLLVTPGRLPADGLGVTLPELGATKDSLPGSGITEDLRDPPLAESDTAGELGGPPSTPLAEFRAASRTSLKKGFLVDAKSAICSSGTVSLFFSRKPSTS